MVHYKIKYDYGIKNYQGFFVNTVTLVSLYYNTKQKFNHSFCLVIDK